MSTLSSLTSKSSAATTASNLSVSSQEFDPSEDEIPLRAARRRIEQQLDLDGHTRNIDEWEHDLRELETQNQYIPGLAELRGDINLFRDQDRDREQHVQKTLSNGSNVSTNTGCSAGSSSRTKRKKRHLDGQTMLDNLLCTSSHIALRGIAINSRKLAALRDKEVADLRKSVEELSYRLNMALSCLLCLAVVLVSVGWSFGFPLARNREIMLQAIMQQEGGGMHVPQMETAAHGSTLSSSARSTPTFGVDLFHMASAATTGPLGRLVLALLWFCAGIAACLCKCILLTQRVDYDPFHPSRISFSRTVVGTLLTCLGFFAVPYGGTVLALGVAGYFAWLQSRGRPGAKQTIFVCVTAFPVALLAALTDVRYIPFLGGAGADLVASTYALLSHAAVGQSHNRTSKVKSK